MCLGAVSQITAIGDDVRVLTIDLRYFLAIVTYHTHMPAQLLVMTCQCQPQTTGATDDDDVRCISCGRL